MSKRKQITPKLETFGFKKKIKTNELELLDASNVAGSVASHVPSANISTSPASQQTAAEPTANLPKSQQAAGDKEVPRTSDLPDIWTSKQWGAWKDRHTWLYTKGGNLGCSACKEAKTLLLTEKVPGVHLSDEWTHGTVSSSFGKKLRKKIYKHKDSMAHKRAVEIANMKQKEVLPNKVVELNATLLHETANSFRTAYTVAKERLSFKKMTPLTKLQELNGTKMGSVHRSDHSCAEIIAHISAEMKKKFVSHIKGQDSRISVTIDESTVHGRAYLIVYVRCDVSGGGDVDNVFLDLVELTEGTDADSIYTSLIESFHQAGLDDDFLRRNLISIATDGASVLTGKTNGVIARLKREFPKVQSIHCLAHRLELAVHDSLKAVSGCSHFEIFISKLYTVYHQSYKNARLLQEAAADLNMQILKIGQVFTIRWVASSYNTVRAVWKDFPALAHNFKTASEEQSRTDVERKKYLGLYKYLTNTSFVLDLACMKDILRELQGLSLKLQKRDTSLVASSRHIQQTIDVIGAMKARGGKSYAKAEQRISTGLFKGVKLTGERTGKINRLQFYQAVSDNLTKRLPDNELVQLLKPLDKRYWPEQREELILFGESQVHDLAKLIGEPSREAVSEFRDWKLQGTQAGKTLSKILIASQTYLPTSAECERGFSAVNDTDSKSRNRLRAKSLSSLLFVDMNGPPLDRFDPAPFVTSWIKAGHRQSTAWVTGKRPQTAEPRCLWSILA